MSESSRLLEVEEFCPAWISCERWLDGLNAVMSTNKRSKQCIYKLINKLNKYIFKSQSPTIPISRNHKLADAKVSKQYIKQSAFYFSRVSIFNSYLCFLVLRDCHLRDNYHVTVRALTIISRYKFQDALLQEVNAVEELLHRQEDERRF